MELIYSITSDMSNIDFKKLLQNILLHSSYDKNIFI